MRPTYLTLGLAAVSCSGFVLLNSPIARGQNQSAPVLITPAAPAAPAASPDPAPVTVRTVPTAPMLTSPNASLSNSLVIKPAEKGNGRFDVEVNNVSLVKFIEELARLAKKKVIITDELRRRPGVISEAFKNQTPAEMMESLTTLNLPGSKALAWGSSGTDTWLVVLHNAPIFQSRILQMPVLPAPPVTPRNSDPFTLKSHPNTKAAPKDSVPFEFNGGTYYYVPLKNQPK